MSNSEIVPVVKSAERWEWVVVARSGKRGRPEHLTERLTLADAYRSCAELEQRGMPGFVRRIGSRSSVVPLDLTPAQLDRLARLAQLEERAKAHARTAEIHVANIDGLIDWLLEAGVPLAGADTCGLSDTMLPPPVAEHNETLALAQKLRAVMERYATRTWGNSNTIHLERELVRLSGGRRGPQAALTPAIDRAVGVR